MKNKNKLGGGFTLAELLVVVAIIAVLVAIAIPVFSSQLEKAREATDLANIRAAYAEVMAAVITKDDNIDTSNQIFNRCYQLKDNPNVYRYTDVDEVQYMAFVELTQNQNGWQTENAKESLISLFGEFRIEKLESQMQQIEKYKKDYPDYDFVYQVLNDEGRLSIEISEKTR